MLDEISRLNAALKGRYRIERELGEGGTATVYLAHDVRHDRHVAIKVLKPDLAAVIGAERFLAEIKTTANLQHPHILPLHDSGEVDGFLFYVMPFVDGESLGDRLDREKQLPVEDAVDIASAVAGALDYAHRHDVIHRDIKPANILIHDGQPVVADFGIALAVTNAGGDRLTETGTSIGTPFYMSPEQASGDQEVGARSDVYSLGCVLYEMLVGDPPHTGSTAQAVLARILTETPSAPSAVRAAVPPNVEGAVLKALERLPADRFGTAADFSRALAEPAFRHGVAGPVATGTRSGPWKGAAIGLGLTAVLATAGLLTFLFADDSTPPVARYAVGLPSGHHALGEAGSNVTISPDGSAIVYAGPLQNRIGQQLWLRQRDRLRPSIVANTEGALSPVFSPDGSRIAFWEGGALRVKSLGGEPPREILSEAAEGHRSGLAWSDDGHLYFSKQSELWRVPAAGGEPEVAVPLGPDEDDAWVRWPDALPSGRGVLFTMADRGPVQDIESWTIMVLDTRSGERRPLLAGVFARYARSGHIVYLTPDGTLLAAPFDLGSLEIAGDPVALATEVRVGLNAVHLDVADDGTLVYLAGGSEERVRPVWVSREGLVQIVDPNWSGRIRFPSLSPDGSRVAVDILSESNNVWIKQLDQGPLLRLTLHESGGGRAAWTPDGNAVSFFSSRGGNDDVWTRQADGSRPAELTFDGVSSIHEMLWSPNGEWLVFRTSGGRGIYAVRPGVDDEPVRLVATDAGGLFSPTLSPDGRYMAFMSRETGRHEISVVPFPNTADARWAVSTGGGRNPRWSPVGDEIFFLDAADNMVSVPVETEPTFTHGPARVLFSARSHVVEEYVRPPYDVTTDGQRFLMLQPVAGAPENQLVVVQGFDQVLEQQVGR